MDITTGQRTFYLGVSSTGTNSSQIYNIPLTDTSGSNINCNYVKLVAAIADVTGNGSFVAELSGLSRVGNMVTNTLSAVNSTVNTSGICGVGSVFGGGSLGYTEWHGSNGEVCNGIKLQVQATAQRWLIGITYGNLLPYNPVRGMPVTNAVGNGTYSAGNGSYDKGI